MYFCEYHLRQAPICYPFIHANGTSVVCLLHIYFYVYLYLHKQTNKRTRKKYNEQQNGTVIADFRKQIFLF